MKKKKNSRKVKTTAPAEQQPELQEYSSYEIAVQGSQKSRMSKLCVVVDTGLLGFVDHYIAAHRGVRRSEIFGNALELWAKETQRRADIDCYRSRPAEPSEEEVGWSAVQAEAIKYIW